MRNKNIIVGITGGIAAYKSAELVRALKLAGANVRVIMTQSAKAFITPLTLQALSGEEVRDSIIDEKAEAAMGHIELARWADLIVIAPASANLISQLAHGSASHLLTTVCLASSAACVICPAMNKHMWAKAVVQRNISIIKKFGIESIGPATGAQACGDIGFGRMSEVNDIVAQLSVYFRSSKLQGKKVLITLGPTREYLDPVRYISNESSGLMGFSLAMAAFRAGAIVTVVAGPTNLRLPECLKVINISSAKDMLEAVKSNINGMDLFIATAAVSDYSATKFETQKIKKHDINLTLSLQKNPDVLAHVGLNKLCPFIVGFAAETNDVERNAKIKLKSKGADLIVANQVGIDNNGFNSSDNQVTVYGKNNELIEFKKLPKAILGEKLIELIVKKLKV